METGNFIINLNDVDEKKAGFEAMPKGNYECVVEDVEFGYSSKTNAPMLTWKFKVVTPEFAKRIVFNYNVLNTEFGVAMLKKTILALGIELDLNTFNPQIFADQGDAIGMPIQVKIGTQKYDGELRNNVKDVSVSEALSGDFGW